MNTQAKHSPQFVGVICALLATLIWSGNFVVARVLVDAVPPVYLSFLRWSVATVAVLPFSLLSMRRQWPIIKANFFSLAMCSFLGVTVFNTSIYYASRTTTTLNLSLISTTCPLFIIFFSRIFLKEPITCKRLAGCFLAIVGIVLLVTRGDYTRLLALVFAEGDLWMLGAASIFAIYSMMIRKRPKELTPLSFLGATFTMGLIMLTPWMLITQIDAPPVEFTSAVIGSILYIGLGASLVAYFLWNQAVDTIGPSFSGIIYYLLPVFSGIEAFIILGEPITILHLVSGALIIGGVLFATRQ